MLELVGTPLLQLDWNLIVATPPDVVAGFEFDRGYSTRHCSSI
jgi:hypothetical protein